MGHRSTLARLTHETATLHKPIDEALLEPLDFLNAAAYRRFLCILYGFQAPLEAALVMTPDIDLGFIDERGKAGNIAADLMSLGLTRHEFRLLGRRQTIGPFATPADALGWMYVTERLTLHLQALRARLEAEIPVVFALASRFICSYGHLAESRWRDFGRMLDRVGRPETVVLSAMVGFDSFRQWLITNGANIELASSVQLTA
jgi:heme oxygenase